MNEGEEEKVKEVTIKAAHREDGKPCLGCGETGVVKRGRKVVWVGKGRKVKGTVMGQAKSVAIHSHQRRFTPLIMGQIPFEASSR